MRVKTIVSILLASMLLGGCAQIDAMKSKFGGSASDDIQSEVSMASAEFSALKDKLSEEELKEIKKAVKKKNETAFWDEFFYTTEVVYNQLLQTVELNDVMNTSNISIVYDSATGTVTTSLNGLSEYSFPVDSVVLCTGVITGEKDKPFMTQMGDTTEISECMLPEKFWKFWEYENSKDVAQEYRTVIGDTYASTRYSYKIAQKIFNAFQLLPEEHRNPENLIFVKENEKYYVDYREDVEDTTVQFHIMQCQVDTDELINCLKGVDVASLFEVKGIQWEIGGTDYTMRKDDYKEVHSQIRYNETIYLDTAINNLSASIEDEVLRGKVVDVLNFVRDDIDAHHRIMLQYSKDYPKFVYLALQSGDNKDTTLFCVNEADIDSQKSVEAEYLCNGTLLFKIDVTGKYYNYLDKARNALYYDYYKWTLPPDNLGGDGEGNIAESTGGSEDGDFLQ